MPRSWALSRRPGRATPSPPTLLQRSSSPSSSGRRPCRLGVGPHGRPPCSKRHCACALGCPPHPSTNPELRGGGEGICSATPAAEPGGGPGEEGGAGVGGEPLPPSEDVEEGPAALTERSLSGGNCRRLGVAGGRERVDEAPSRPGANVGPGGEEMFHAGPARGRCDSIFIPGFGGPLPPAAAASTREHFGSP